MDIKIITPEEATNIVTPRDDGKCSPIGLFIVPYDDMIVAIDNSTGEAWSEEFPTLTDCYRWLRGEEIGTIFTDITFEGVTLERIHDLIEADKERRLVVLPCRQYDTVWFIKSCFSLANKPIKAEITRIRDITLAGDIWYETLVSNSEITRSFHNIDIGKTVFLSYQEAEEALRQAKETDCEKVDKKSSKSLLTGETLFGDSK